MLATSSLLAGTACQSYSLVEANRPHRVRDLYTVIPDIAWSKSTRGPIEIWTVDGPALESVRFSPALADGDALFDTGGDSDEQIVFRAFMNEPEIAEFVAGSIARTGAGDVETFDLAPASFAGRTGFRFGLSFRTAAGLEMRGLAQGAVVDEELLLVLYWGAASHYYERYAPHVEQLIRSLEMP